MNNIKTVMLNVIFGVIWEYITVPSVLGYMLYVAFNGPVFGFNVIQLVSVFIWARFAVEFAVKTIAEVWYGEKYNRQK